MVANNMPIQTTDALLAELRGKGWAVAVHNDYRLNSRGHTFWLLTHPNGRWVKGEGADDVAALIECRHQISRCSMDGDLPGPYAVELKEVGTNGWVNLGFDTYERAEQFWRWAEKELQNARR